MKKCEYAAAPFCSIDMPSRALTWSITLRHDMLRKCHKPAGNSRGLDREREKRVTCRLYYDTWLVLHWKDEKA